MPPALWRLVACLDRWALGLMLLATLAVSGVAISDRNTGVAALFAILFVPALLLLAPRPGRPHDSERLVFLTVFAVASLAACATYVYYMQRNGTPYPYELTNDDYVFDNRALDIYTADLLDFPTLRDDIAALGTGTWNRAYNYSIFLAFAYRGMDALGFDPHPLYPRLLNALLLAALACLVHSMARHCALSPWQCRLAAYLCCLSPMMLYVGAHTYRDTLVSFGIAAAVAALVELCAPLPRAPAFRRRWTLGALLLLAFGLVLSGLLRATYLPVLCATALVGAAVSRLSKRWCLLVVGGLAVLAGAFLLVTGTESLPSPDDLDLLEYYHTRHSDVTGNITGVVFRLPYLVSLPARFVLRNVAPLPLPQELATDSFQRLGTILWFFSLPFLFRSLYAAFRTQTWWRHGALRIVACGFLAFYALNIGTTLQDRHVVSYLPAASVVISHGLVINPMNVRRPILTMLALAGLLILLRLLTTSLLAG
jgi:hypothetical protein